MAVLEEGKEVFLLDDVVPGAVVDGNGDEVPQPLSREDFKDVRPWAEVQQPAAGAVISEEPFPVVAEVRARAVVALFVADGLGMNLPLKNGSVVVTPPHLFAGEDRPVEASVIITVTQDGERYRTEVPLTLQP